MKNILGLLTGGLFLFGTSTMAQMVIDNSQTPQQLVQNVLLGQGVVVSNITFTGDLMQIGYFDAANANFPIAEGIIMSSGSVTDVPGTGGFFASTGVGGAGDADLDLVSSAATQDAVVLEFDFVPTGDSINFDYIFGSEEYPEYVNAGFNDVFVFIISGPGFAGPFANGGVNIALIPGTVTPVTIDNVNDGLNAQYYIDNDGGTDPNGIVYDGYTVTLTALAEVECGETYHLKFAISDAGDGAFDSGVFLEAHSFSSNAVEVNITTASGSPEEGGGWIAEDCTPAEISFTRPASATDTAIAVVIEITGSAINGVDYTGVPDTIYFEIGDTTITIELIAFEDNMTEVGDSIVLTVYSVNLCGDITASTGTIHILDAYEFIAVASDDLNILCQTDSVMLSASAVQGNPAYSYSWSNGTDTSENWVVPLSDTVFYVIATDECDNISALDSVVIEYNVMPDPTVILSGDTTFDCVPETVVLTAIGSDGLQPYTYIWSNAAVGPIISVQLTADATFYVSVLDNCGILSQADTIHISQNPVDIPDVQVSNDVALPCPGDEAVLTAIATGGTPPYSYIWSTAEVGSTISVQPTETTEYIVSVTDNCFVGTVQDTITVTVLPYTEPTISIPDTTVLCPGDPVILNATVENGLGPFSYVWSNGDMESSSFMNADSTMEVTVSITDFCDNSASDDATVSVPVYDSLQIQIHHYDSFFTDTLVICELWGDSLSSVANGGLSPYDLYWSGSLIDGMYLNSDSAVITVPYELPPDSTVIETYLLVVVDQCFAEDTAEVIVQIISCDIVQPGIFNPGSNFMGTSDFCGNSPQNNVFNLPCLNLYPGNVVRIWDRWGRKCYEQENYHLNPWDGGDQSAGVYYYVAEIPGGKEPVTGYFHLVR